MKILTSYKYQVPTYPAGCQRATAATLPCYHISLPLAVF